MINVTISFQSGSLISFDIAFFQLLRHIALVTFFSDLEICKLTLENEIYSDLPLNLPLSTSRINSYV